MMVPTQAQPREGFSDMDVLAVNGGETYDHTLQMPRLVWRWEITVVDGADADVGEYGSLTIPAAGPYAGRPAICYFDATNGNLKFAWQEAQAWHCTVVDSACGVGTSLAFWPDVGEPWISYVGATDSQLKVAFHDAYDWDDGNWNGMVWYSQRICDGEATSLKFKTSGWSEPAVAFRGFDPDQPPPGPLGTRGLLYQEYRSIPSVTFLDPRKWAGWWCSMAIDPDNGLPAIAYTGDWGRLTYTWMVNEDSWHAPVYPIGPGIRGGWYCSLAFFPSDHPEEGLRGEPAIAYYDSDANCLHFAWRHDGVWHHTDTPVDGDEPVGTYPSLAIRRDGHPAISYAKDGPSDPEELRYAYHISDSI